MPRVPAAVGIVAISSVLLAAMPRSGGAQSEADAKAAVHRAVDAIVAAIDRNDVDAFERLTAPDYTFVTPAGQVWPKAHYVQLMRSGALKSDSYGRDEETVQIHGDTALVIYRSTARGTLNGQVFDSQRRVTTVLMNQDGRWVALARQSTPILTAPASRGGGN